MNLPIGYTGAYQDPVTVSYPLGNGHRIYLPELMRFAQPDVMSPFDQGGVNAHVYCGDDPVNHSDPSGHFALSAELGIRILAIGFVLIPGSEEATEATDGIAIAAGEAAAAATEVTMERAEVLAVAEEAHPFSSGAVARVAGEIGNSRIPPTGTRIGTHGSLRQPVENIEQPGHAPINYADIRTHLGGIKDRLNIEEPRMRVGSV